MPPRRIEFGTNEARRKIFNIFQSHKVLASDFNADFKIHKRFNPIKDQTSFGYIICKALHHKVIAKNVQRLSRVVKKERLYYKKMIQENCFSEITCQSVQSSKKSIKTVSRPSSSKACSVSSEEEEKFNVGVNMLPKNGTQPVSSRDDDFSPFMDLIRSLLFQYPRMNQLSMQKKIISDLYDGLMDR